MTNEILTPEQLAFWGSEANFLNHTHGFDELDVVYTHDYVKTMTMLFNESKAEVERLQGEKKELMEALGKVDKSFDISNVKYADWVPTGELIDSFKGVSELLERLKQ